MFDRFEQLVTDAQLSVVILGNLERSDVELFDIRRWPVAEAEMRDFHARGLYFIGIVGFVDGAPRTALAPDLDARTEAALAGAVVAYFMTRFDGSLTPKPKDDFVQFADGIMRLEDPRA